MNINGIGILFSGGFGISSLEKSLRSGWTNPPLVDGLGGGCGSKLSAFIVDLDRVEEKSLLKKMRRCDKLSRMAVLAASDALKDSGMGNIERERISVILVTAFGAHLTTFGVLDNILDYGETAVSPTIFSSSVHNAAASYVTSVLDIKGPTLTVTNFHLCFHHALQLAQAWLTEERYEHVLVGALDQYGDVMRYAYDNSLRPADDGKIKPFNFSPTYQVPGEGAAFFLMGKERTKKSYCAIENLRVGGIDGGGPHVDLQIIDTDGMLPNETAYNRSLLPGIPTASYSPLFGTMMICSAFNCAVAALMIRSQELFANPIVDNPHEILLIMETRKAAVESVRSIRYNCRGREASFYLKKL